MPKKSKQKLKYLENHPRPQSIFRHFWRAIIKVNKKHFLECESSTLKIVNWAFEIGEIAELKIAIGQNIAWIWIAELKKHFWVENKELKIASGW